ncbi:uncharacterized [Tachysurus ichikawai]
MWCMMMHMHPSFFSASLSLSRAQPPLVQCCCKKSEQIKEPQSNANRLSHVRVGYPAFLGYAQHGHSQACREKAEEAPDQLFRHSAGFEVTLRILVASKHLDYETFRGWET